MKNEATTIDLIAFGRKLANMPGMHRRKCETCTRYLVKRVGL